LTTHHARQTPLRKNDCGGMGDSSHSDTGVLDTIPNGVFIVHELEQGNIVT
jgi:hypothetical protein